MIVEISLLLIGAILSFYMSNRTNSNISEVNTVSALQSEIEENREKATEIIIDLRHDIWLRNNGDNLYSWSTPEFTTSSYDQLKGSGSQGQFSGKLEKRLRIHYQEVNRLNQRLSERQSELLNGGTTEGSIANDRDWGLLMDMVLLCSSSHCKEILESENNDGTKTGRYRDMVNLIQNPQTIINNLEKMEELDENQKESLYEKIESDLETAQDSVDYTIEKDSESAIEKMKNIRKIRKSSFDSLSDLLSKGLDNYNQLVLKLSR